ncbi:T9SS type A sorting domain-containing protein [bacterium SCSIO 12741]|nr:T9SS type A sorting domain-containing protein [bacterium SCSIO 12741]
MKNWLLILFVSGFCLAANAQYDTLSIDSIQFKTQAELGNCDDESRYSGDTVYVRGFCLVDGIEYGSSSHNIQISQSLKPSPFGGLRFRQGDPNAVYNVSIRSLKEGDEIIAVGHLSQYQGETQFEPLLTNSAIKILSRNNVVEDTTLSVGTFNDNQQNNNLTTGEQWESSLVTLTDLEVVSVNPFSGNRVSFVVKDKNGDLINVGDHFFAQKLPTYTNHPSGNPGTFAPPSVGDKFNSISGIIIHSKNNCPGENNRGYEIHPYKQSHYNYGPSAPRISNINRTPAVPTSSQAVDITADIVDLDGSLVETDLYWATGTDPMNMNFTKVAMTLQSGFTYKGTIPAQADGTFIRYYLRAKDDSSNVTQLPGSDPTQGTYTYRVRDNGLSIFDVQFTPFPDGNSPYLNQEVTVTGVVTATGKDGDLVKIHIQDENALGGWSGVEITNAGQTFERGDKIEVTGNVQEAFGLTQISFTTGSKQGTGTVNPLPLDPDSLTSYNFARNEKYEGVLIALVNGTGDKKVHVVDTNADAGGGNNFAEYRVGTDELNPASGARILAGREGVSSIWVSYVNASTRVKDPYPTDKVLVSDTMHMDTLIGIASYSFGNMKLLPRNNDDFVGINHSTDTTQDTTNSVVQHIYENPNFQIYPNPAGSMVNINNLSSEEVIHIYIRDLSGKTVFVRYTALNENRVNLDTFDAGIYQITITTPQGALLENRKLVVQ